MPMDSDRRTCTEGRARFAIYKAHVASSLAAVELTMPKPWFEDLVCRMARLKIRCDRSLMTGEHALPSPASTPEPQETAANR